MTMEHQPSDPGRPPELRASDQDRDNAAAVVQDAHADGRLDFSELEERLEQIYVSKTRTELERVTADLVPYGYRGTSDVLTLRTKNTSETRDGEWRVPPRIIAITGNAPVRLDFTAAVVRLSEILVEVHTRNAPVVLVVPEGWRIEIDEIQKVNAGVKDKTGPPRPGTPRVRITGETKNAPVVIRHPRRPALVVAVRLVTVSPRRRR